MNPPTNGNAGDDEFGPVIDDAGNISFYSFRAPFRGGSHYVIESDVVRREVLLPDPSASTFVCYLTLSRDGNLAVMEGRALGRRDTDLFVATRDADGSWSAPLPINAVNTEANEGTPYLTPVGEALLFASTRSTSEKQSSASNIYVIGLKAALAGSQMQPDSQ